MAIKLGLVLLMTLLVASCAGPGRIFTNIIEPYSLDFHNTPIGSKHCIIKNHIVKEPISGYGISAEWIDDDIARAAWEAGITKIHYSEMRTFSILLGIYKRKSLIIYGD